MPLNSHDQPKAFVPLSAKKQARRMVKKKKKRGSLTSVDSEAELNRMINVLMTKTEMTEEELKDQYKSFLTACPKGEMSKAKFCELSEVHLGPDARFLTDALFRIFDEDNSGSMDFTEYMLALNSTKLNDPQDKIKWIFHVFDRDGSGTIEQAEIEDMVNALCTMSQVDLEDDDLEAIVRDIMECLDQDGDGEITLDEFVKHAITNEFIYGMLGGGSPESE